MYSKLAVAWFVVKTIDEVFDQREFVALPAELQHRLAMLAGIEPATYEVDVLRYGSQLCIGGDEVVVQKHQIDDQRCWAGLEPASRASTCLNPCIPNWQSPCSAIQKQPTKC